ncbi:MAG: hypothetical protein JNL58_25920 [Planctomyces sp.]|nr:hypothetical protein [Planctomyces sp.]
MSWHQRYSRDCYLSPLTILVTFAALFANHPGAVAQSAPRPNVDYAITWIDPIDSPFTTTVPSAINDLGDTVGSALGAGFPGAGWIRTAETGLLWAQEIAVLPPGAEGAVLESCKDITNDRIVVGNARLGGLLYPYQVALVLDQSTGQPIPQVVEFLNISGTVESITESGDLITSFYNSSTNSIRWQIHRPKLLTGGYTVYTATSYGIAIGGSNSSAQFVTGAKSTDKDRVQRTYGLQYTPATGKSVKFPGFVAPGTYDTTVSFATGINDPGTSVGAALFKSATKTVVGQRHAALFNGTSKPTDLGVLGNNTDSVANAINNANQVVGASGSEAFLWTSTNKMHSLDSLVFPDSRWVSAITVEANRINNPAQSGEFGEILGTAKFVNPDGSTYRIAFLLTPIEL